MLLYELHLQRTLPWLPDKSDVVSQGEQADYRRLPAPLTARLIFSANESIFCREKKPREKVYENERTKVSHGAVEPLKSCDFVTGVLATGRI